MACPILHCALHMLKVVHMKPSVNPSLLRYGGMAGNDVTLSTQSSAEDPGPPPTIRTPMDELRVLRKEVKVLRRQLSNSSAPSSSPQPVPLATAHSTLDTSISLGHTATSVTTLTGVDSNKMNARLKEMFRERINSYREAVYLLFGYKVPGRY